MGNYWKGGKKEGIYLLEEDAINSPRWPTAKRIVTLYAAIINDQAN